MSPRITPIKSVPLLLATGALLLTGSYAHAHSGSLNGAALQACEMKGRLQPCQYQGGHNDLFIGTCQLVSEEDLICVRNQPIQVIEAENLEADP